MERDWTCRDPFDTKKISNLSPEILVEWIAPYILFRIRYISEEKYGNDEPVCQKWKSQKILVDRGDPEYSGPKNLANCIDIMENIGGFHVSIHCSMASEVMKSFFSLFIYFYQSSLLLNYQILVL